ncbi:hypothetical protein [Candidatus Paracaedibacter symbiosus]|uniref:hypothetical protein n=1 Tax=Candidatus Paracaedibacter symbiosus TaxID=244582 RepID=UPI0005093F62|nr:hypothetical protein [Candidatus Paracaedibacter symbiosus]
MKKIKLGATMGIIFALSGCACPDIIEPTKVTDQSLDCGQLRAEMEHCEKARREVQAEKGATGTNVAAAIFFWPGLIATHMNVNDAIKALDERKANLNTIYQTKKCNLGY